MRTHVASASPFESRIGFSRAVRVGPHIAVSGTAPIGPDGATVGVGDIAAQTRRCLEIALAAVEELGGSAGDVVRTRVFVTDITKWDDAAVVHGEVFAEVRPAATMLGVAALIDPDWLVEIEVDAYVA